MTIYFVTPDYLKLNTTLAENVDVNTVTPLIRVAADAGVRSYIGLHFYTALLVKFNAQTLTMAETILVQDYIQPAIAWRACAESTPVLTYQLKNKGLQTQSGDNSTSPEFAATMFMYKNSMQKAEMYDAALHTYLAAVGSTFPDFMATANNTAIFRGCDTVTTFDSGILFL